MHAISAHNITTLKQWLKIPWLGTVAYNEDPAKNLNIISILQFFTNNSSITR